MDYIYIWNLNGHPWMARWLLKEKFHPFQTAWLATSSCQLINFMVTGNNVDGPGGPATWVCETRRFFKRDHCITNPHSAPL